MLEEVIDIWNAKGQPTGSTAPKSVVHKKGWFHPTVHVWFYTSTGKILLQKRGKHKQTFPNLWDVSVAGHVEAGETIESAALREIKEEIGISISSENLNFLTIRKNINRFANGIIDCEFQHVFIARLCTTIEQLNLQCSEVEDVRLFTFDEIKLCMDIKHPEFKIVPADMNYYQFVMDHIRATFI